MIRNVDVPPFLWLFLHAPSQLCPFLLLPSILHHCVGITAVPSAHSPLQTQEEPNKKDGNLNIPFGANISFPSGFSHGYILMTLFPYILEAHVDYFCSGLHNAIIFFFNFMCQRDWAKGDSQSW